MTVIINGTTGIDAVQDGIVTSAKLASGQTLSVNGIKFPATQVASADANTLDDYEEGTWTPVLRFGGSDGVSSYGYQNGSYTKIGNTVTVRCYILINTKSAATGAAYLYGLPFVIRDISANYQVGVVYMAGNSLTGAPMNYMAPGGTVVNLGQSTSVGYAGITNSNFSNGGDFIFQVTYITA